MTGQPADGAAPLPVSRRRRIKNRLIRALAMLPVPVQRFVAQSYVRWAPALFRLLSRAGSQRHYRRWVRLYDTLSPADRTAIAAAIAALPARPVISVAMPVYNPPAAHLRAALDSVLTQLYPDWELCIADDASAAPHVARVLAEYAARDPRICVVTRPVNGGISAASNDALGLARGTFVALLDHDDVLPAHALFEVARAIAAHPDADLIYSDEDKIDGGGRRFDPYFKSDWNPDLFLAQNMVSHLGVYRTALVRDLGGFRSAFDGSQDYDLALRVVERTRAQRIHHIPRILYHWRAASGSTALRPDNKPTAALAARRAVADHLRRRGIAATVEPAKIASYQQIRYPLARERRVSIIIPTRDRVDLLARCVDGILTGTRYRDLEILIVDNGSVEPASLDYLRRITADPRVRVLPYPHPFNYSLINNWAAEQADGEILLFLNNDIEIIAADWLRDMVANAIRPEIGAVGAKLLYPNGRIQHGGVILGIGGGVAMHFHLGRWADHPGYFGRAVLQQNLSAVTAACMAMRRDVFRELGGFDGDNLRVAFNDIDLCLRLRARGMLITWTPSALLYHHESASRGPDLMPERHAEFTREVAYMERRWGEALRHDPYYNPNLTLRDPSIGLAFPPRIGRPGDTAAG